MTSTAYRVVTIPKLEGTTKNDQLALAHKFRNFRLLALRTAPGAFATSYEEEVQRGLDHTFQRLKHAKATQFVALASEASTLNMTDVCKAGMTELLGNEWLGFIVLIGPEEGLGTVSAKSDPFGEIEDEAGTSMPDKKADDGILRFHLNGMFVCQSARRCGMGARLIGAALDGARLTSVRDGRGYHCTIIVDEWNQSARKLYECVGFKVVATETYGEDRIALRMELRRGNEAASE